MHTRGKAVDLWQLIAISEKTIGHTRLPLHILPKANITKLQATPLRMPLTEYV